MRLTVLGGYLGAGKTTWLRHQLHTGGLAGAEVLVNEAAETPVDDALVPGGAVVLSGGCACCEGRTALVMALRQFADRASRGAPVARVVLETSGLADPAAIVAAVQSDPVLVHHVRLDPIVVMVDALHGLSQLLAEPLARRQVAAADRIVVTKTEAAPPAELAGLLATLGAIAPGARIEAAVRGESAALPPLPETPPADLPALAAEGPPPQPFRLLLPPATDWTALAVWLSALLHARGEDLVRVKGVVRTPAGRLLIQTVRRVVQQPEILPEDGNATDNALIFIGRGISGSDLERSFHMLALGRRPAGPDTPG